MVPDGLRRWLAGGRTGVKVCGVTRKEDAHAAVDLGVDALGFNFYPRSKRVVRLEEIADWVADLPPDVGRIAVVVQPDEELLERLTGSGLFHALQFHGGEDAALRGRWGGAFHIMACPLAGEASADAAVADAAPCLLLDAHAPGEFGGTGRVIDWSLAAQVVRRAGRPVVLSGGLNPSNVADAVRLVHPAAVDTASGVESSPGRKNPDLMQSLVAAVCGA